MPDRYYETEVFALGDLIVDPITNRISTGEAAMEVQPKAMELLLCLVGNYGQIVSKEFLFKHVWPGTFVVDGALRRAVFILRKAMGGEQGAAHYVKTIPRHGYRLLVAPRRLTATAEAEAAPAPRVEAAYRGLHLYEPDHASIFCGRQAAINQVIAALDMQIDDGNAFVLLLGASGSGKSSLARAGVLPEVMLRAQNEGVTVRSLIFQISESAADPMVYFASRLVAALGREKETADHLVSLLEDNEGDGVDWILRRLAVDDSGREQRLVLVFDQFEELLTPGSVPASSRERLISLLYFLARSGKIWIIATMRSEFFPRFMSFETLRFLKGTHSQFDLAFPRAGEIADIVRLPAEMAGFSFGADENGRPLDQLLIEEASEQPDNLPLLQFALRELELHAGPDRVLSYDYYREIGNIVGCLSMYAERTYAALDERAHAALPLVLDHLVLADPRNAGRLLKRSAALSEFDGNEDAIRLIQAFVDARLMTSFLDRTSGAPSIQLVHEAVLEHWHHASNWVQENYADIRFRDWLSELAERWDEDERSAHYLLRDGKMLFEAKRLVSAGPESGVVADFVTQSDRRTKRGELLRKAIIGALVGLSVAAIAMWQLASLSSNRADRATRNAQATAAFLVSMFENANPGVSGNPDMTVEELLNRARSTIDSKIEQDAATRTSLHVALAETYILIGNYEVADELLSTVEDSLPFLERNSPDTAVRLLLELGGLRMDQGHFEESAQYLDRALEKGQQLNDASLIASILNVRGLLQTEQQNFAEAVDAFNQALVILDKNAIESGDLVKLRANVLNNTGMSHIRLGNLDLADQALQSAISLRREHGLENTAEHSDTLGNLGSLLRQMGRNEDAVASYEQAIELRTRLHGPQHPSNAIYLVNLVSAQLNLGRASEAASNAERGLAVVAANAGAEPVAAALLKAKLVIATWLARGSPGADRVDAARDAISTLQKLFGDNHPVVLETRAAVLGTVIDAAPDRPGTCEDLRYLQTQIDSLDGVNDFVRQRLQEYVSTGRDCD